MSDQVRRATVDQCRRGSCDRPGTHCAELTIARPSARSQSLTGTHRFARRGGPIATLAIARSSGPPLTFGPTCQRTSQLSAVARKARAAAPSAPQLSSTTPGASQIPEPSKHERSSHTAASRAAGIGQSRQRRTVRQHGSSDLRAVARAASRSPLAGHGMSPKEWRDRSGWSTKGIVRIGLLEGAVFAEPGVGDRRARIVVMHPRPQRNVAARLAYG